MSLLSANESSLFGGALSQISATLDEFEGFFSAGAEYTDDEREALIADYHRYRKALVEPIEKHAAASPPSGGETLIKADESTTSIVGPSQPGEN